VKVQVVISTGKSGYPICSSKQLGAYSREMPDDGLVQSLPLQWVNSEARRFTQHGKSSYPKIQSKQRVRSAQLR